MKKERMQRENEIAMFAGANNKKKLISVDEVKKTLDTRVDSKIDPEYGKFIAKGYDELKNTPNNPEVKKDYSKFIDETVQQAMQLQANGMKFEPSLTQGYDNVKEMSDDIENNNHLFFRPSDDDLDKEHPLHKMTVFRDVNGKPMRANDVFRAVHDVNGHYKGMKAPFTPEGEQRAFIEHKKMYSPDAIKALFTETQGQGSWVNFNDKSGKKNRDLQEKGDVEHLTFPKQKAGLFPDGVVF